MQKFSFISLRKSSIALLTAFSLFSFTSCGSDDNENEEPTVPPTSEESTPMVQEFEGTLSTTLPAMPNFGPVESDVDAKITWLNTEKTAATINLGAFTIEIGMPGRGYEIGEMEIEGIVCESTADGIITLHQDSFSCQAGEYATTGSLIGEYHNGRLSFTILYKPGSMPFEVQSTFTSK